MQNMVDNLIKTKSDNTLMPSTISSEPEQQEQNNCSYGTLTYPNGNIYQGQLLNGQRSGTGRMRFENGDVYQGMWKNDQMCDHDGHYTFGNGNTYNGSFQMCSQFASNKFGMIHGKGILNFIGLGTFEGNFQNGNVHGQGHIMLQGNEAKVEGIWENQSIMDLQR